jgi:flagellar biogenesis protein FliO
MKSIGELERRSAWSGILKNPVLKPLALSAGLVVIGFVAFMAVDAMGAGMTKSPPEAAPTQSAAIEVAMGEKVAGATVNGLPGKASGVAKSAASRPASARTKAEVPITKDSTPSLWRTGLALVGCMALLFGLAWWLKNHARDGRRAPIGDKLLKIRDVLNLGPKRQVFVLSVEGRTLVVGLADNQFTLLTEMTSDEPATAPAPKKPDGGHRSDERAFEDELVALATASAPGTAPTRTARAEAAPTSSDAPSPARLKLEAEAAKDTVPSTPVAPAFPFSREQVDRVPPKFRHLLNGKEQGASA